MRYRLEALREHLMQSLKKDIKRWISVGMAPLTCIGEIVEETDADDKCADEYQELTVVAHTN